MHVHQRRRGPVSRALGLSGAVLLATSAAVAGLGAGTSSASSHREAPLIAADPQADNTDTYAFVSPDRPDYVTLVANWIPFEEPNGGPNFYPFAENAHYNIKIDNRGTGKPDLTYQWTFHNHVRDASGQFLYNTGVVKRLTDKTLNFYQTYDLDVINASGARQRLLSNAIAAPSDTGKASMPNYGSLRSQAIRKLPRGGQTYVGQADDPFFLDLRVFDLLYGGNLKEVGHDTLAGYNVNTIALQLPKSALALRGNAGRNPVIGVWSTTDRKTATLDGTSSKYTQVSRLGSPLVNEVVVPLKYKDAFNALPPEKDHTVGPVVDKVTHPILPALVQKIYGLKAPKAPRNDLVEIFLTGIAKNAPTLDGSRPPIQADLNSQVLNKDVRKSDFVPAEELRLNTAVKPTRTPNRLGVLAKDFQGYPNGRRLADDVVDISLQAVEGAAQSGKLVKALAAGDGVNANDHAFGAHFPYLALPNTAAVNQAGTSRRSSGVGGFAPAGFGSSGPGTVVLASLTGLAGLLLLGAAASIGRRRVTGAAVVA